MNALLGLVLSWAAATAPAAEIAPDERRSGYDFAGPGIRAMRDDTANPGMLWVLQGETLWASRSEPQSRRAPAATATRCRLEWQSLGSLQRRLRGCMAGVRAAPFDYGAPQSVALEFYLMERSRGTPMDAPAVRP